MTGKDAEKIIDAGLVGPLLLPAARIILAKWRNEKLEHELTKQENKRLKEGRA